MKKVCLGLAVVAVIGVAVAAANGLVFTEFLAEHGYVKAQKIMVSRAKDAGDDKAFGYWLSRIADSSPHNLDEYPEETRKVLSKLWDISKPMVITPSTP